MVKVRCRTETGDASSSRLAGAVRSVDLDAHDNANRFVTGSLAMDVFEQNKTHVALRIRKVVR